MFLNDIKLNITSCAEIVWLVMLHGFLCTFRERVTPRYWGILEEVSLSSGAWTDGEPCFR